LPPRIWGFIIAIVKLAKDWLRLGKPDMVTSEALYKKNYRLRVTGYKEGTVEVSVPKDMVMRLARRVGLTIREYIKQYRAVAIYDEVDSLYYRFEKIEDGIK